jgi:hypothetical protein
MAASIHEYLPVGKPRQLMPKRPSGPGILPPLNVDFETAVMGFLGSPPADYVKGSRAVNLKKKPKKKRTRKKGR